MSIPLAKGAPVVSLADGAKLGTIDHVYVDPESKAVVGFTFHQGGGLFGRGATGLVDIADVHAFGADAVTISDAAAVRSELAVERYKGELLDLESLLHRSVLTESGALVGRVRAILFGDASYQISALEVDASDGQPPVRISAARIQTIGADVIIVADAGAASGAAHAATRQPLRVVTSAPDPAAHQPERVRRGA